MDKIRSLLSFLVFSCPHERETHFVLDKWNGRTQRINFSSKQIYQNQVCNTPSLSPVVCPVPNEFVAFDLPLALVWFYTNCVFIFEIRYLLFIFQLRILRGIIQEYNCYSETGRWNFLPNVTDAYRFKNLIR
jgi:hypothetical protein